MKIIPKNPNLFNRQFVIITNNEKIGTFFAKKHRRVQTKLVWIKY